MLKFILILLFTYTLSAYSSVIDNVREISIKCEINHLGEYIDYIDCSLENVSSPEEHLKVTSSQFLELKTDNKLDKTIYVDIVGNDKYPLHLPDGIGLSINGTGGFTYKNTPLKYIKREDFKDMASQLYLIILEDNKIEEIPYDTFYDLQRLYYLDIRRNKIKSLPTNLFHHAPHFSTLIVEENQIAELNPDLFKECPEFYVLYAEFNEISEFHVDLFKNNPNMEVISMRHNKISNIPIDFTQFKNLSVADFTHNGGTCDTMYFSFKPYVEYYDENEQKKWIKNVPDFQRKIEEVCRA